MLSWCASVHTMRSLLTIYVDISVLCVFYVLFAANLPADKFCDILSEHTSGVYFGWAGLRKGGIYKMVMSIGWNPYFHNSEKTIVSGLVNTSFHI
jgi:FAD synthase